MRRTIHTAPIGLLIGIATACQSPPPGADGLESSELLGNGVIWGTSPTGDFESVIVFTGIASVGASCEMPQIVYAGRVFRMTSLFPAASWGTLGRLGSYCRLELYYDNGLGWPPLPDVEQFLSGFYDPTLQVGPDHIGLVQTTPQYGALVDDVWIGQRRRFLAEIGAFDPGALPRAASPRIALIDSAPTASTPGWTSNLPPEYYRDHGVTLARIAEELLCPGGNGAAGCLADIVSVQTMSETSRGVHGTLGDLAAAIVEAVEDAPNPSALIINLSVGWVNPAMGGDHGDIFSYLAEEPAAASVHEALQYARCRGAAIFAAAGNRVGAFDDLESDLIRPAHFFASASTPTSCSLEFGFGASPVPGPLVTAVGAIADGDQRLAVVRWDSEPTLVANSLSAVATKAPGVKLPTALLSGTSVGTLVASAQTAILQHVLVGQPVQALEASLPIWTRTIPRWSETGPGLVHVLDLAEVVRNAGGPVLSPYPYRRYGPPSVAGAIYGGRTGTSWTWCSAGTWVFGRPLTPYECSFLTWQSVDELPYTRPQPIPTGGGCPGCGYSIAKAMLFMELPPGTDFVPAFLELLDDYGSIYVALPKGLSAGSVYEIRVDLPRTLYGRPAARLVNVDEPRGDVIGVEIHVY